MSEVKVLAEGYHITYAIDNCKTKVEIQKVLDSLTNISLAKHITQQLILTIFAVFVLNVASIIKFKIFYLIEIQLNFN